MFSDDGNQITFTTVDRRKCPMHGEIHVQPVGGGMHLIAFKKSKVRSGRRRRAGKEPCCQCWGKQEMDELEIKTAHNLLLCYFRAILSSSSGSIAPCWQRLSI